MSASVRMALRATAASIVAALVVAACSNPNAANEANFRKALEPLVADAFCRSIDTYQPVILGNGDGPVPAWPIVITAKPLPIEGRATRKLIDRASSEGMLRRTARTAMARGGTDGPYVSTALVSYEPTERGRALFRAVTGKAMDGRPVERPSLCLARGAVGNVVRWTEPADLFGRTVTQVTYTLVAKDMPADIPAETRAELDRPVERNVNLALSNDGWQPVGR